MDESTPDAQSPGSSAPKRGAERVGPLTGNRMGAYTLRDRLGGGTYGEVYKASDLEGGTVAIKVMNLSYGGEVRIEVAIESAQRERKALEECKEIDCVVNLVESDLNANPPYLVLEQLDGWALSEVPVAELKKISLELRAEMLLGLLDTFSELHDNGTFHEDIKANNIFLCRDSWRWRLVVIDFGYSANSSSQTAEARSSDENRLFEVCKTLFTRLVDGDSVTDPTTIWGLAFKGRSNLALPELRKKVSNIEKTLVAEGQLPLRVCLCFGEDVAPLVHLVESKVRDLESTVGRILLTKKMLKGRPELNDYQQAHLRVILVRDDCGKAWKNKLKSLATGPETDRPTHHLFLRLPGTDAETDATAGVADLFRVYSVLCSRRIDEGQIEEVVRDALQDLWQQMAPSGSSPRTLLRASPEPIPSEVSRKSLSEALSPKPPNRATGVHALLEARQVELRWSDNQTTLGFAVDPIHVVSLYPNRADEEPRVGDLEAELVWPKRAGDGLAIYRVHGYTGAPGSLCNSLAQDEPSSTVALALAGEGSIQVPLEMELSVGAERTVLSHDSPLALRAGTPVLRKSDGLLLGLVKEAGTQLHELLSVRSLVGDPTLPSIVEHSEITALQVEFERCLTAAPTLEVHLRKLLKTQERAQIFDNLWLRDRDLSEAVKMLGRAHKLIISGAPEDAEASRNALLRLLGWIVPRGVDWDSVALPAHLESGVVSLPLAGQLTMAELLVAKTEGRPFVFSGLLVNGTEAQSQNVGALQGRGLISINDSEASEVGAVGIPRRSPDRIVRSLIRDLATKLCSSRLAGLEATGDFDTLVLEANRILRETRDEMKWEQNEGLALSRVPFYVVIFSDPENSENWRQVAEMIKDHLPELVVLYGRTDALMLLEAHVERTLKDIVIDRIGAS